MFLLKITKENQYFFLLIIAFTYITKFSLQLLSSSEIVDLKYKNRIATLTINEVFPEDEGEYTCIATNSIGSDTTSCKLTIKRKSIKYFYRHFIENSNWIIFFIFIIIFFKFCKKRWQMLKTHFKPQVKEKHATKFDLCFQPRRILPERNRVTTNRRRS